MSEPVITYGIYDKAIFYIIFCSLHLAWETTLKSLFCAHIGRPSTFSALMQVWWMFQN